MQRKIPHILVGFLVLVMLTGCFEWVRQGASFAPDPEGLLLVAEGTYVDLRSQYNVAMREAIDAKDIERITFLLDLDRKFKRARELLDLWAIAITGGSDPLIYDSEVDDIFADLAMAKQGGFAP